MGLPRRARTLAAKLVLFCAVMVAAGLHGWATGNRRPLFARVMALAALAGSVGIVLLASALPVT